MIKIINDKQKAAEWFGNLDVGDTFIYGEELYIKSDKALYRALNLSNKGDWEEFRAVSLVIPVDIEIKIIEK